MKMRHWTSVILALAMIFALSFPAMADVETDSHRILYAGQNIPVGFVDVSNDGTNLFVTYQLDAEAIAAGWQIIETHLAVSDSLAGIPTN